MLPSISRSLLGVCLFFTLASQALGQVTLTWQEVRDRFEAGNPTLRAGQIGIDESRAEEITAHLRPNPSLSLLADQLDPFSGGPEHGPFSFLLTSATVNYLHERQHKRELRTESAKEATDIAVSGQSDLERTLVFALRGAFVGTLQAKAVLHITQDNLAYWDKVLDISRNRFRAGDLAQVDLDRLELQRVQFESDLQTALVNLRTQKIALLTLLNDRTPVDQFDVPEGIFTTTVAFVLLLAGSAARTSDSLVLAAVHVAVVHDCALAAIDIAISSKSRSEKERERFMMWYRLL